MLVVLGAVWIGGATAAASCAGGPTTSADGTRVTGSPCADLIIVNSFAVREVYSGGGDDIVYANPYVAFVNGGEGDDVIYGELPQVERGSGGAAAAASFSRLRARRTTRGFAATATISIEQKFCKEKVSCYGGIGSQELIGSSGNDRIFGQRGNDILKGNAGEDQLFGGIGDECPSECAEVGIAGGAGNDLLSGGLGADHLNGNQDSDLIRGDGTIDTLQDSGESGTDTLSFASGVMPGFHGPSPVPTGFPADSNSEERGVYLRLDGTGCEGTSLEACNNAARYGGGSDEITVAGFENVIGTPFADYIVGSAGANRIDGGGGADAIYGGAGNDELHGGADGDYLKGEDGTDTAYGQGGANNCDAENVNECSGSAEAVTQRDRSKISVGFMVPAIPAALGYVQLYLTGSTGADNVMANFTFDEKGTGIVTFTAQAGSAKFDTSGAAQTPNCTYEESKVECALPKPLDAVTLAGGEGNDTIDMNIGSQSWETTTPVLLGNEGGDFLYGTTATEDTLVDGSGAGADSLHSEGADDALINNEGQDILEAGYGNDLLLSATNCEGDTLQGASAEVGDGAAQNSSSWAKLETGGVFADLVSKTAGNAAGPSCSGGGTLGSLRNIDDLEGSSQVDELYGDGAANNLLGRLGKDGLWGRAGADNIEAKDGEADKLGGGEGTDSCSYDSGLDTVNGCP